MILVSSLWTFCRAVLFGSAAIALENLALRHQLLVCLPFNPSRYLEDRLPVVRHSSWVLAPEGHPVPSI
jgi:hypothetical protein